MQHTLQRSNINEWYDQMTIPYPTVEELRNYLGELKLFLLGSTSQGKSKDSPLLHEIGYYGQMF